MKVVLASKNKHKLVEISKITEKFNMELVRGFRHTREDWVDILATIDAYELYCEEHKEYKNSRAVHAITNIEKLYDERLEKNDFA